MNPTLTLFLNAVAGFTTAHLPGIIYRFNTYFFITLNPRINFHFTFYKLKVLRRSPEGMHRGRAKKVKKNLT